MTVRWLRRLFFAVKAPIRRPPMAFARLSAAFVLSGAAILPGCVPGPMIDRLPSDLGGLPAGTPARPAAQPAYPAVHDMPPAR